MRRLFEAVWRLISVDYKYPGAERLSFTQFEAHDIRHVTEMYPRCPVFLLQRPGVTNTSRRRVLKYLKIHAERLSVISDKEQIPLRSELLKPTIGPPQNRERSHFSETVASFVTDSRRPDFKEFFLNKKTLEPSLVEGMLPPFPQEQTTTQQGLCTYCYQPLNETDPKGWKAQIYQDLQPYICTFLDCTPPIPTFGTIQEWQQYDISSHQAQLDEQESCPLCNMNFEERGEAFYRHVGEHMERLALFVMPTVMEDEESWSGTNSNAISTIVKFHSASEDRTWCNESGGRSAGSFDSAAGSISWEEEARQD